jgi:phosphoglycerate dehydrogenase-like enzyme
MCSKAKIPSSTFPSTVPLTPAIAQVTALAQERGARDAVENGAKYVITPPP